jgi:hypothetical protein
VRARASRRAGREDQLIRRFERGGLAVRPRAVAPFKEASLPAPPCCAGTRRRALPHYALEVAG